MNGGVLSKFQLPSRFKLPTVGVQVASSFLIEIGNGDKFLFDMGSGSYQNLLATGNYAIDKVLLL